MDHKIVVTSLDRQAVQRGLDRASGLGPDQSAERLEIMATEVARAREEGRQAGLQEARNSTARRLKELRSE